MKINQIVETCLYAEDLEAAGDFYEQILGLRPVVIEKGRHVFFRCGDGMLLIFNPDHTANVQTDMNGDPIPLHGARGPGHVAFSVHKNKFDEWRTYLQQNNVEIESEVTWPNGAQSIYFRDTARNSVELIHSDIWELNKTGG